MGRFSALSPLSQDESAQISIQLCNFFNPLNNANNREDLGLPHNAGSIVPLSLIDFFKWSKKNNIDLWPNLQRITELILKLEQKGILIPAGTIGKAPQMSNCYYFTSVDKNWHPWLL
jgi:hypothetical protein